MDNVINLLKECGAIMEGHFLLSSGRHSDLYVQCAKLLQHPCKAEAVLAHAAQKIKDDINNGKFKVDIVAGPAIGGIVAAYELGRQLGLPAIFTERGEDGLMTLRRGFEIEPGQSVLIIEDVVTTGKSSLECAKALEAGGAKIAALACIIDRRAAGENMPWPFYSAAKLNFGNWDPGDCELCKKGMQLIKPGSRKNI